MASPTDEEDKGASWKEQLLTYCEPDKNIAFFDPYASFKFRSIDTDIASYIHDINKIALERADILVGSFNKGQTSIGTPIELYQACNNKPMIIITNMTESVYMHYISKYAILVEDVLQLYGRLIKIAKEIEEQRAKNSVFMNGIKKGFEKGLDETMEMLGDIHV